MFYVYQLVDPRDGHPFYVGKGKRRRAWDHVAAVKRGKTSGNKRKDIRISAILSCGSEPEVRIVAHYDDEDLAYDHEIDLIASSVGLLNISKGGEGFRLSPQEAERRAIIRDIKVGHRKHLKTRSWLERWFAMVSSWPGVTFPGMVDGDRKAAEMLETVRELLSVPVPPLESQLSNI